MPEVPQGWETVRLDSLADNGGTFVDGDWIESKDQDPDGGIRLLQVGNVLRGRMKLEGTPRWVNDETARRLGCTLLKEGDVLIARMPDPIGRAALIRGLPTRAITAVDCAILRTSVGRADRDFIVQLLNSDHTLSTVISHVTGSTRQRISRSNLGALPLLLPPLPEQRKIAAILSSVDETIEKTEAVIAQLDVVKKAMLEELLTRGIPGRHSQFKKTEIGEVPEKWRVVRLEDVCESFSGGTPARSRLEYFGGPIPWVKSGEVGGNRIRKTEETLTEMGVENSSAQWVPSGSTLVAMYGATAGQVGLLEIKATTNQAILALVPRAEEVESEFLYYSAQNGAATLLRRTQGSGQPNLNAGLVRALLVAMPPHADQQHIARILGAIEARATSEQRALAGIREAKTAMSFALLTGALRVQEATVV